MQILFEYERDEYKIVDEDRLRGWLENAAKLEGIKKGEIRFILVSKDHILQINSKYLGHNYLTDIITFDNSFLDTVVGEIHICIEVVRSNAKKYAKDDFDRELKRNFIHGVLHLAGYKDKTEFESARMRQREDFHLDILSNF